MSVCSVVYVLKKVGNISRFSFKTKEARMTKKAASQSHNEHLVYIALMKIGQT